MKKQNSEEQRISIRFPAEVLEAIRTLAQDHERSFNGEVIWALREYVEREGKARLRGKAIE